MHAKHIDLARTALCYRDDAANDRQHVSVLVWVLPLVGFWLLVWAALT
jgi:hypothetical protein